MSQATPANVAPSSSSSSANQQLIFDFTKRKRWADLLVSELSEAIMLVLSQTGQVWFCGPAVKQLLGWKDEEVVDGNFCDIMNADDRQAFQRQFTESVKNHTDLLAYARLQCKSANDLYPNIPAPPPVGLIRAPEPGIALKPSPREILFEIKGYPHIIPGPKGQSHAPCFDGYDFSRFLQAGESDIYGPHHNGSRSDHDGFKCFFAMAKPYPSRNTAMLNTFLELKMENERLQARFQAAKTKAEALKLSQSSTSLPSQDATFTQPGAQTSQALTYAQTGQPYSFAFPSRPSSSRIFEPSVYQAYETTTPIVSTVALSSAASGVSQPQEDDNDLSHEHNLPRKKSKRALGTEMYVCMTCGRTDSPEWRKGPQGPKTLCNACGLRWAKSVRGPKESHPSSSGNQPFPFGTGTSSNAAVSEASPTPSTTLASTSPGSSDTVDSSGGIGPVAPYNSATFDFLPVMYPGQNGFRWY